MRPLIFISGTTMSLLTIDDVQSAWDVIVGKLPRTPIITSEVLGNMLDVRLFFKAELFQKTGSFKVRGALNKLNSLTPEEKLRRNWEAIPQDVVQSMAFEREPVLESRIRETLARIEPPALLRPRKAS